MKKVIVFAVILCIFQALAWLSIRFDVETRLIPPDAVLPDGSRYFGELLDGRFHGKGKLLWSDGARYEGEFRHGLMSGAGELRLGSGDVYTGDFKDGMMSGRGELRMTDDSVYAGEFLNNLPHGQGELKSVDGYTYKGGFAQWKFHGEGVYTGPEGEEYRGEFVEGKFTGRGVYTDADGNRYEGAFQNWKYHGEGVYTGADGGVYRGVFEMGELNGKGVYEEEGGERYEGEFRNWLYHGAGTLIHPEGDRYTGSFEYGRPHGPGELTFAEPVDGLSSRRGEWAYGEFQDPKAKERDTLLRERMEQALYRQHDLLEEADRNLAPGVPGEIDLYFVGFAAYGQQNVFMKESLFIRELFDSRFGAAGRSVLLINNPDTIEQLPLATRSGLERLLRSVAAKMNPDEDVLFLYLTSHGTSDHRLSIGHPGVKLPGLTPEYLSGMLKALPIRWKVVAVSACYSGGFIPALRDENTLVMTAASAERQSFGCSDSSDMTWFAKAYFRDSLPQAASFEEAFENARKLIAEWEIAEIEKGGEHSEPQIAAGAAVAAHLEKWWRSKKNSKDNTAESAELNN